MEKDYISDLDVLKSTIIELSDLIIKYRKDLKKGILINIIDDSNNLIRIASSKSKLISNHLVIRENTGLNISIPSLTGPILFPSMLYNNPLRILLTNQIKTYVNREFNIKNFGIFLYKLYISTQNVKKAGFTNTTLEILRFYLINFNSISNLKINDIYSSLNDYKAKYTILDDTILKKKFNLIQKYSSFFLTPNYHNLGLNGLLIPFNEVSLSLLDETECSSLGYLFTDTKKMKFMLLFTKYYKNLKNNFIEKVTFFENLDLFYRSNKHQTYYNYTENILTLFNEQEMGNIRDTACSYSQSFFNKKKDPPSNPDLDLIIHLFNIRRLPKDHRNQALSQKYFSFRNGIVNFYPTIRYFIYIFEPNGKMIISHQLESICILLKNTFSNGFIIQSKSGILLSTVLFKADFEKQKKDFLEFFYLFRLEVKIFENLNYTPFSFYHIPNSTNYNSEDCSWNFPLFQEKPIEDLMEYQVENLQAERNRLQDPIFKRRVDEFYNNWSQEIKNLNDN